MDTYKKAVALEIETLIKQTGVQPIIFVGSGLSRRYFSGPSWDGLLKHLADKCPDIDNDFAYYKQSISDNLEIGEIFAEKYRSWAWKGGKNHFPKELFAENVPGDAYMKYAVAEFLKLKTPKTFSNLIGKDELKSEEIKALQGIHPHAVITTNFDTLLETIFDQYKPVIGQQVMLGSPLLYGEIFKIHGCVTNPNGIVITKSDFERFMRKEKYLIAKLLTYFAEHPVFFLGYSASDPNIKLVLSDVADCVVGENVTEGVLENVYLVEWKAEKDILLNLPREKLIGLGGDRSVRVKSIQANDFTWVYKAIGACPPLEQVSPKVLRSLLERSYHLVRHDIPRKTIEVDFKMLKGSVESDEAFARLFGITTIADPTALAAQYPYGLSEVAEKVFNKKDTYWSHAQKLITQIITDKGIDIKSNDNAYHMQIRTGKSDKSQTGRYSQLCVELLIKVHKGEKYEVCI